MLQINILLISFKDNIIQKDAIKIQKGGLVLPFILYIDKFSQ